MDISILTGFDVMESFLALLVGSSVAFVVSFFFFSKVVKLDKMVGKENEHYLPLLLTADYGKKMLVENRDIVASMLEVNTMLKLINDEQIILKSELMKIKLDGADGITELTKYFIKDSESHKKLFIKVKANDAVGVKDFSEKSMAYICYFITKNNLLSSLVNSIEFEKDITKKYDKYSKAKVRLVDLELYSMVLKRVSKLCKSTDANKAHTDEVVATASVG